MLSTPTCLGLKGLVVVSLMFSDVVVGRFYVQWWGHDRESPDEYRVHWLLLFLGAGERGGHRKTWSTLIL
jgi:hypothetical protein